MEEPDFKLTEGASDVDEDTSNAADGISDVGKGASRHVTSQGGAAGAAAPLPLEARRALFGARSAPKGPTRPREAQFLESLEVLRATRALSERPEGPMDVQRAPVQVRGPLG